MPDKHLDYVQAVVETGSLQKAAEAMFITPSALSKYIQRLEQELNVPLFKRVGKRFVLTYAGERYLNWQRKIKLLQDDMRAELYDIAGAKEGRIRFGLHSTEGVFFAENILPKFYEKYPNVDVELTQKKNWELRSMLENQMLDFALINDGELNADFTTQHVVEVEQVVLVAKNHPLVEFAQYRPGFRYLWIDGNLLKNERFLIPSGDRLGVRNSITQLYGYIPNVTLQTDTFCETLLRCVEQGLGITISTDFYMKVSSANYKLTPLSYGEEPVKRNTVLAYHKNHYVDKASQYLIDLCKELAN